MRRATALRQPALTAAVAAALLLSGCRHDAPHRSAPSPTHSVAPPSTSSSRNPLTPYYAQRLTWRDCGGDFTCATLKVPLDYAHPASSISLALIRLRATGPRLGSLVLNPGGPGVSGIDYARSATAVLSDAVRERFDVVGFDPRGVGASTAVDCVGDRDLDALVDAPPAPRTARETAAAVAAVRRLATGCRANAARLLPHVGTPDAARDLDVLRAALGEAKLTYLGKSYGTYLGATYAELFPTRVRAAVLDGALDPSLTFAQLNAGQAAGFEAALRSFLRACGVTCGASVPDAVRRLDRVLAGLHHRPLPALASPGGTLGPGEALYGVAAGLYRRSTWPLLAAALRSAERGDGSGLLALADALVDRDARGHYSNELEANTAINCVDHPTSRSLSAYAAEAARLRRSAPHFGPALAWQSVPCAFWPVPPTSRPRQLTARGAPPILVVGTTRDPATPYPWAVSLARQLSSGRLLTWDGDGHTAYRRGSACVDRAVDDYLIAGRLPASGARC
jgi:pimeloyl-ACP methyl ester carboxylesterase